MRRSAVMNTVFFVAVSAATIAVVALVLGLAFTGGGGRRAMAFSAGIALCVQCITFVMVQRATRLAGRPIMSAWVAGMVLRFVVMAAYALLIVRAWQLAPTAALVSLAI